MWKNFFEIIGNCITEDSFKKTQFLEIETPNTFELAISIHTILLSRTKAHAMHMQVDGILLDRFFLWISERQIHGRSWRGHKDSTVSIQYRYTEQGEKPGEKDLTSL